MLCGGHICLMLLYRLLPDDPLLARCRQLEDKHLTVQTSDHSKVFQFQVRENPKGRFLRVFENGSGCGSA